MTNEPLCNMSGIDQEIKDFVKTLEKQDSQNAVELNGDIKTEDQDIPSNVPGIVNGPAGTAPWGIGKLHKVHAHIFVYLQI